MEEINHDMPEFRTRCSDNSVSLQIKKDNYTKLTMTQNKLEEISLQLLQVPDNHGASQEAKNIEQKTTHIMTIITNVKLQYEEVLTMKEFHPSDTSSQNSAASEAIQEEPSPRDFCYRGGYYRPCSVGNRATVDNES